MRDGASGGVPRARASASAVAKPIPSTSVVAYGSVQHLDRAGAERAVDARGGGGRNAVALEEQPHRPQRALLLPRAHRRADLPLADPRHLAQRAVRVAVDGVEDALDAVAVDEPGGAADADVLDRVQVGEHRGLAGRLPHADALDRELRAVARVAAPVARDVDGLARVDVRERAREDDLLALVADAGEHGEIALLEGVAHRRHLDRQLWHKTAR